jgi:hypothetical protein
MENLIERRQIVSSSSKSNNKIRRQLIQALLEILSSLSALQDIEAPADRLHLRTRRREGNPRPTCSVRTLRHSQPARVLVRAAKLALLVSLRIVHRRFNPHERQSLPHQKTSRQQAPRQDRVLGQATVRGTVASPKRKAATAKLTNRAVVVASQAIFGLLEGRFL